MGATSKSARLRGATQKLAAKRPGGRGRGTVRDFDSWEQMAQLPDESYDETDCQRIVKGEGRSLPLYYEDYN